MVLICFSLMNTDIVHLEYTYWPFWVSSFVMYLWNLAPIFIGSVIFNEFEGFFNHSAYGSSIRCFANMIFQLIAFSRSYWYFFWQAEIQFFHCFSFYVFMFMFLMLFSSNCLVLAFAFRSVILFKFYDPFKITFYYDMRQGSRFSFSHIDI